MSIEYDSGVPKRSMSRNEFLRSEVFKSDCDRMAAEAVFDSRLRPLPLRIERLERVKRKALRRKCHDAAFIALHHLLAAHLHPSTLRGLRRVLAEINLLERDPRLGKLIKVQPAVLSDRELDDRVARLSAAVRRQSTAKKKRSRR